MHAAIDGFAHVVDGEQGGGDGGKRFHLNSGAAHGFDAGLADHARGTDTRFKCDIDFGDRDRVAKRDEIGGALGPLDRGDARDAEHIAFFAGAGLNHFERGGQHSDLARGARDAMGFGFAAHIYHVGLAVRVEVGEGLGFWHGNELMSVTRYHSTMKFTHLLVLGVFCTSPANAATNLPDLGEASQSVFSPQLERKIGEAIMRDIRADRAYLDDPEVADYLNGLGYRLAAASPNNRQDFEFFAVRDNTLNAFALPGGYIGVHSGLILTAQSESELAGVLAHEIAHVTQRHISRMVAQESRSNLISIAAIAVSILAARANSQVASAAATVAQAGVIQNALDFTRENEHEADRVGFQIMQDSGLDPRGMASFFDRMGKFNRLYDNNAPVYLRTHPLTTDRLADIQNRLAETPYKQVPDSLDYQLVRAKLRAASGRAEDAVTEFETGLKEKKFNNEIAQRYGLAAALARAKKLERAEKELAVAQKNVPAHPMIETLAAELKRAQGQESAALAIYRAALKRFPFHRALIYDYADTLLQTKQGAETIKFVNEQLKTRTNDYRLYEYQARGYAALQKRFHSHRALAEAYARRGNLTAAIEQLQIALKSDEGDFYQLSSAEARLKELKALDAESKRP